MPSLFGMLGMGSRALGVQSSAIEVIGNNIANASTPGYHRQSLSITPDQVVGGYGQGAFSGGIRRAYSEFTENQLHMQTSVTSHQERRAQALGVVDAMFNESSVQGLSGAFDEFYASFAELGTFPDSGSVRATVLGTGRTVVRRFNDLSSGLETLKTDLDKQIAGDVTRINEITERIAALNASIAQATGKQENPANQLDQRAQLVDELNTFIDTRLSYEEDGQLTLTVGGMALVQDGIHHDLATAPDPTNNDHLTVMIEGSSGGYRNLGNVIEAGSIGANLELRDVTLEAYTQELDALAFDFANRLNEVHSAGYGLDGSTGNDFFEVSATVDGAAAALRLSSDVDGNPDALAAASDPAGLPGGSDNALALYATANEQRAGLGDVTFQDYFVNLSAEVGADARFAETQFAHEENQLFQLTALNQSQTGVNMDEEAAELQKFEAAYQAAARFVSIVDEMLDVLMRM